MTEPTQADHAKQKLVEILRPKIHDSKRGMETSRVLDEMADAILDKFRLQERPDDKRFESFPHRCLCGHTDLAHSWGSTGMGSCRFCGCRDFE